MEAGDSGEEWWLAAGNEFGAGESGRVSQPTASGLEREGGHHHADVLAGDCLDALSREIRHGLGNPINSVKTVLNVLIANLEHYDTSAIREYLERSQQELGKAEQFLKDLRELNRFEHLDLREIPATSFIEKLLAPLRHEVSKKGITLTTSVGPGLGAFHADQQALRQVFMTVLANAVDACRESRCPEISLAASRTPEGMALVRITDNGRRTNEQQGVPFTSLPASGPQSGGLGLLIASRLLLKMKGSIEVKNFERGGTAVDILIPTQQ